MYGLFTYMYHKNQPFMQVYIPVPWILWVETKSRFSLEKTVFFLPGRSSILPVPKNTCSFGGRLVGRLCVEQGDLPTRQVSVERSSSRCLCWQETPHMVGARKIMNNSFIYLHTHICIYIYLYYNHLCLITKLHLPKVQVSIAMLVYQKIICDEGIHTCAALVVRWRANYQEAPFERGAHFEGREIDANHVFTWSWYVLMIHPRCLRMWPLFPCSRSTYRLIKLEKNGMMWPGSTVAGTCSVTMYLSNNNPGTIRCTTNSVRMLLISIYCVPLWILGDYNL